MLYLKINMFLKIWEGNCPVGPSMVAGLVICFQKIVGVVTNFLHLPIPKQQTLKLLVLVLDDTYSRRNDKLSADSCSVSGLFRRWIPSSGRDVWSNGSFE